MTVTQSNPYSIDACRICGSPPRNGAVGEICTKCMLVAGLAAERKGSVDITRSMSQSVEGSKRKRFEPPSADDLKENFPQLEILEIAGVGGMGVVYKARQKELDRVVALKVLPIEIASDPAFAARFSQEARALAMLNHTNVVQVYETGKSDQFYYFLMEYVDGINLRQVIRDGNMKPEEALSIVPQICEALQFAHSKGIVHRDIKPENILIDKDGVVKVADFGLAKLVDCEMNLTATQQVMGTVHYMAPEQVRQTSDVDHRADLYSLGVVFYEMLTGQLPLGKFALPSDATSVHSSVDSVVLRTLENEPDQRYQSASEMQTDIASVNRTPQSNPRTIEPQAVLARRMRDWLRHPGMFFLIASLVSFVWVCCLFFAGGIHAPSTGEMTLFHLTPFFLTPVLTFIAGWLMVKRQPIQLLRFLVGIVFLRELFFSTLLSYGFWYRLGIMFGYYPEWLANGNDMLSWLLSGLALDVIGIGTLVFATICLIRLFSQTARDLRRIEIANKKRGLSSAIAQ